MKHLYRLMHLIGLILAVFGSAYLAFVKSMAMGKPVTTSLFIAMVVYFSMGMLYFALVDLVSHLTRKKRND